MPHRRRKSINTILGITQAKRRFARVTGIPTTKSGRKRKMMNTLTGGAYERQERARAARNRARRSGCLGCCVYAIGFILVITIVIILLI